MTMLAAGEWQCGLLPALGGAIGWLRWRDGEVLRATADGVDDPLATACFPLVPYANRIARGRFVVDGEAVTLPRNFGDHPHPLHGVGWHRPWEVSAASDAAATLTLTHEGDADWPWPFVASQVFALDPAGLSVTLTVEAGGKRPMPAGLGFHPYFPAPPRTRLRTEVAGAWLSDEGQIPVERVAGSRFGDWASGELVARGELVDHCHDGWSGEADILMPAYTVRLSATGARWLHLYMPPGEPFFCAEPVTHLPDAVNRAGQGMAVLHPGEAMAITMRIAAEPA